MIIRTLLIIIIFCALPSSLRAQVNLRFQSAETYKEKQVVEFVKNSEQTYFISKTDLNDDAIDEYIVRFATSDQCSGKLCPYSIVAFQEHEPILLGQFDAHKILISNKKTYGIRQIIVYNDPYNDFKNTTAIWNPFSFKFETR